MITIITKNSSFSCRNAKLWLLDQGIEFNEINLSRHPFKITREILIQILSLQEEGVPALYGRKKKSDPKYQGIINSMGSLSFDSALEFLQKHLELLCTPIIFDEIRIQLGYDRENIRMFIPKEKRKIEVMDKITQLRKMELLAG